jgi:Mrp family chromosome partitioning ATPase
MERLQAAIEKARTQREGKADATPAPAAAAETAEAKAGAKAAGKPATQGAGKAAGKMADASAGPEAELTALWRDLQPIDAGGLLQGGQRSQIVTLRPGAEAVAFDILRTRILHQAQTNGWKRIAIISPHSGCGKTLTTANLAFSFARQNELRTLVLDLDLRRATLARTLGQTPAATMGDVLEGRVPFARHALRHGENLAFGLNREPVAHSSELLQSTKTREMLAEIEATYRPDIILFDVPPLRATDDSIGILQFVDAAVIIVAAEETPMKQIDVVERQVAELTNVMGIVLNKCRIMDDEYGYEVYSA